jgi:hypothetical protein
MSRYGLYVNKCFETKSQKCKSDEEIAEFMNSTKLELRNLVFKATN